MTPMTLERWLTTALHNLAPEVRQRLADEYREHVRMALETAHAEDAGDAQQSKKQILSELGDPERLNRELLATHLTEYEAKVVQSRVQRWTPWTPWGPTLVGGTYASILTLFGLFVGIGKERVAEQGWALDWSVGWAAAPLLVGFLGTVGLRTLRERYGDQPQLGALYGWPALSLCTLLVVAAGQAVWRDPTWPKLLGFVLVAALLFVWTELGLRGSLYRKARQSGWRPE